MSYQYGRNYVLYLWDRDKGIQFTIQDLRISFDAQYNVDNKAKTNTASIKIYNLGQELLDKLSGKENAIYAQLDVGYGTELSTIILADVLQISTERQGIDKITTLKTTDGYVALNSKKISKSYPEGVSVGEMLTDLFSLIGVAYNPLIGNGVNEICTYGYPAHGTPKQVLDDICIAHNIEWMMLGDVISVKDRRQLLVPKKSVEYALVIGQDSGLIDIPYAHTEEVSESIDQPLQDNEEDVSDPLKPTKSGKPRKRTTKKVRRSNIQLKALLNPKCKPNSLIKLETVTTNLSGFYRVRTMKISGDTRGNDWTMELFCDDMDDL